MKYKVIAVGFDHIKIWDGKTKDKHKEPAGVMTITVADADHFEIDDEVLLIVQKVVTHGPS